jgi:uncharacterized protein
MTTEKPSRNEDEYFARQDAELLRQTRERERLRQDEAARRAHYMKCPKDGFDLATQSHHGVQVDVCPHCGGLWLDAGELEELIRLEDKPGMLRRVIRDVMSSLGGRKAEEAEGA